LGLSRYIRATTLELLFLLVFVFALFPANSQDKIHTIDNNKLETLSGEEFRQTIAKVYDSVSRIHDLKTRQEYLDKLFELTAHKDELAHIHSLLNKAMSSDSSYAGLFEKAFRLAEKYDRTDDMCLVEYSRARFFIARKQYDSAMIHILNYRDMTPASDKGEGYRNIINLLGDIYFHAGLYDQARDVYLSLYQNYVNENNWNFYRPYVMMNNLGQIAIKTGKTHEARDWFSKSLSLAEQHLHTPYKTNTLAYTKVKLAETALMSDSLEEAEILLNEVTSYPEEDIFDDVLQEYFYIKAQLLLKQQNLNRSQEYANLLTPGYSDRFKKYRFIPDIYKLQSEIFRQKGDYPLAVQWNNKYSQIADSLKEREHVAQSMIILADRNHENTRLELQKTKQRISAMIIGFGFLTMVLAIIIFMYRKLYKSKLELVRKSLEQSTEETLPVETISVIKDPGYLNEENSDQEKQLILKLKGLMEKERLFLDPKLNIQEVAVKLSSNRTYLSRAINNQLKTTFPNFINGFRIQEAIKLITSGYLDNLTQDALAKQSGFSSRTVFISAFKKHTGLVPSFFIANFKKLGTENQQE